MHSDDKVSESNVSRQRFYPVDVCIDKAKVSADMRRFLLIIVEKSPIWLDLGNRRSSGQIILGHTYEEVNKLPSVFDL
ncbi:hypothetical protein NH514_22685 [Pseudoalteromonas sp. ACER1]|uniref:hypothetical protein n=1 Tax=unclassified Pseudoalteromonas TaxID=194690 RepID=UPI001F1C72B6|nr:MULTISPECIES: hypothetical protein [unclassified Pseudoalteromonas]MCF2850109.1 hypothetical protein [Pseudoalteromonas sp. PAST1]MCF2918794.1 hypothetical protein [Pseudoalteromonas sp. Cn5-37]MCO7213479.1 hypothetical protein [Pseudoalteromonas sp. ACER1]MCO7252485.1 hypothetical protein [Pseudoalteromonas sp. Ps84H-4]